MDARTCFFCESPLPVEHGHHHLGREPVCRCEPCAGVSIAEEFAALQRRQARETLEGWAPPDGVAAN